MLHYLLDTNIISSPVKTCPDEILLGHLHRAEGSCAIAAPVWHELQFGVRCLANGHRRRVLEAYLNDVVAPNVPILPYGAAAAAWHGEERARLATEGVTPPFVDAQIAAIACVNGLTLVTRNGKDYRFFTGLRVTDWM